jgi:hypothetical protein
MDVSFHSAKLIIHRNMQETTVEKHKMKAINTFKYHTY